MKKTNSAWTHMRRTPYQSVGAILAMFLTFLLGGIVVVVSYLSLLVLTYFESKPQLTIFFTENVAEQEVNAVKTTLEGTGKVSGLKYVSKEAALEIYKEQNKNDPLLLEMVTADILPASLEVTTTQPKYLAELEPIIKKAEGVEEVVFQKDIVDTLLSWTNAVRIAGSVLAGLLALNSLFIVGTVIAMKIALKKEEIEILRLIGASNWYIRKPFLVEGALYGAIGGSMAWVAIMAVLFLSKSSISSLLGNIPSIQSFTVTPFSSSSLIAYGVFFLVLLFFAGLLGMFGSLLSLSRYRK